MAERRLLQILFAILCGFFLIANRGAYRGYFQDDDLDNLSFTRELGLEDFLTPLAVPRVYANNFRPVGHLFYRILGATARLKYPPYIFSVQFLHLLNVLLLWFVLRRMGLPAIAACAGVLFWAFHMAAFDVYWKPMYVFDLLCGAFCLLSLLAYQRDRWIVSLLAMWLAYRSKEVAIMLPVVLTAYEFLIAEKRWRRLLPFWGLSIALGIQALVLNAHRPANAYSLRLDPASIWQCIEFYSSKVFLLPNAGFAVLLLFFVRDRRALFGVASFCALLVPMLLLPGRLFSAYLYVPLIGLAIAFAAVAEKQRPIPIALFFLIWLPWNYVNLRRDRREALSDAGDRRTFVRAIGDVSRRYPDILTFVYDHGPVNAYGSRAAVKLAHPLNTPIRFATLEEENVSDALNAPELAVLSWDPGPHQARLLLKTPETPEFSYLTMNLITPIWQLKEGWYPLEAGFRWIKPHATAVLNMPTDSRKFELVVNIGPQYIEKVQRSHVAVMVNGKLVGEHDFTLSGWQTVQWDFTPQGSGGEVPVEFRVSPEFHMNRTLGIAVVSFGFVK